MSIKPMNWGQQKRAKRMTTIHCERDHVRDWERYAMFVFVCEWDRELGEQASRAKRDGDLLMSREDHPTVSLLSSCRVLPTTLTCYQMAATGPLQWTQQTGKSWDTVNCILVCSLFRGLVRKYILWRTPTSISYKSRMLLESSHAEFAICKRVDVRVGRTIILQMDCICPLVLWSGTRIQQK